MKDFSKIKSTAEVKVSNKISEQIIGQETALTLIKKAAKQRRNVLLIGEPGTGKSMLGQAVAELLPKEKLIDIVSLPNLTDENTPVVKTYPKGEAKKLIMGARIKAATSFKNQTWIILLFAAFISLLPYYFWKIGEISDIIYAASMITGMIFIFGIIIFINLGKRQKQVSFQIPKLLVDNSDKDKAPFIDGSGAHAGALLGDVLHDPLQSFSEGNNLILVKTTGNKHNQITLQEIPLTNKIDEILSKKELIEKEGYKAAFLDEKELQVLAEAGENIQPVEVLSVNKYPKEGELIKITTESGKELIVTPEHKVAVKRFGKIIYKEAGKLTRLDKVITFD